MCHLIASAMMKLYTACLLVCLYKPFLPKGQKVRVIKRRTTSNLGFNINNYNKAQELKMIYICGKVIVQTELVSRNCCWSSDNLSFLACVFDRIREYQRIHSLYIDVLLVIICLANQARARGVEQMRDKMFSGEKINITEVKYCKFFAMVFVFFMAQIIACIITRVKAFIL